nr:golgin subfamily A member 6-like protein 22 [Taeniopygia guttata]
MALIRDLQEEMDRIKSTQIRMEGDVKKVKESLPIMKKLEEDLKKLREDATKWKEESSNEISQQIEALRQDTKRELQKMGEQQERRNAMLEEMVTETANQVNEQLLLRYEKLQEKAESLESRQMPRGKLKKMMKNWGQLEHDHERLHYMEETLVRMKEDCEKLSFVSGSLQKDAEQKQKAIKMLFQSLEKVQKEKTDEQDVMAAVEVVQSQWASLPAQGFPGRVPNAPCPLGAGLPYWPGEGAFPEHVPRVPSPSRWWEQTHQGDGANGATAP